MQTLNIANYRCSLRHKINGLSTRKLHIYVVSHRNFDKYKCIVTNDPHFSAYVKGVAYTIDVSCLQLYV